MRNLLGGLQSFPRQVSLKYFKIAVPPSLFHPPSPPTPQPSLCNLSQPELKKTTTDDRSPPMKVFLSSPSPAGQMTWAFYSIVGTAQWSIVDVNGLVGGGRLAPSLSMTQRDFFSFSHHWQSLSVNETMIPQPPNNDIRPISTRRHFYSRH